MAHPDSLNIPETYSPVYGVDTARRIVHWNEGARRVLGYAKDDVLNRPCYSVIRGTCGGTAWCRPNCRVMRSVRDGKLAQDFNVMTHHQSGSDVWLNVSIFVVPDTCGPVIVHLLRDITTQLKKIRTLNQFTQLLSSCIPIAPNTRETPSSPESHNALCLHERLSRLTPREIEVLTLLSEGLSTIRIADRLCISPSTVRRHVENILKKTSLHSRAEAIAFAYRCSLLSFRV